MQWVFISYAFAPIISLIIEKHLFFDYIYLNVKLLTSKNNLL